MAATDNLITDLNTIISTGFSATAKAAAIAAAGPIMDLEGMAKLALLKAQELKLIMQQIDANVGAGADSTVQTAVTSILDVLV